MKNHGLCQAGELLAQRMDIGVKNLQTSTSELKVACSDIVETLQDIRNSTTSIHTRLSEAERKSAKNECQIFELNEQFAKHAGEHAGAEKAGEIAGKKYGAVYGFTSAVIGSSAAIGVIWKLLSSGM